MEDKNKKVSTEPYKGVRDFYPEDMAKLKKIFSIWRDVVEKFGYEEYNASILESAELYKAKSGEEIVNEQTYTFTDRGGREVTLRPEMTPTLARMISARKRDLSFPLRWYSIPNLFRYEQPQRGRLREHFQLNVDIFGIESSDAEVEIIEIASEIMKSFGLQETDFEIRINSRKIMNYIMNDYLSLNEEQSYKLSKLIDKKSKISKEEFTKEVNNLIGNKTNELILLLSTKNLSEFSEKLSNPDLIKTGIKEISETIEKLEEIGITNVVFDQTLMRGFDYYTGVVFEIFDTNPLNRRSLFGGGRYDDLLSIFDGEKISAVGFGSGDVTALDILETRGIVKIENSGPDVNICTIEKEATSFARDIADTLRKNNIKTTIDFSDRKLAIKIKQSDKKNTPFIIVIGLDEEKTGKFKIKNMKSGEETEVDEDNVAEILRSKIYTNNK